MTKILCIKDTQSAAFKFKCKLGLKLGIDFLHKGFFFLLDLFNSNFSVLFFFNLTIENFYEQVLFALLVLLHLLGIST